MIFSGDEGGMACHEILARYRGCHGMLKTRILSTMAPILAPGAFYGVSRYLCYRHGILHSQGQWRGAIARSSLDRFTPPFPRGACAFSTDTNPSALSNDIAAGLN